MRAVLAVGLLALAALATASDAPDEVLVPWKKGSFGASAPVGVDGANAASFPFHVGACRRQVLVDLLYDPEETLLLDLAGVAEVAYLHTFRLELRSGAALVATRDVAQPEHGYFLHQAREGPHAVRLVMTQGADVDWQLRVRAWEVTGEPACLPRVRVSEVEADPAGADAGAEWVEIENLDPHDVDLAGWTLRALHGRASELTIPAGTVVPAGGRVVVAFTDGQFLDNADEVVQLARLSIVRDETPMLTDGHDDARSWQRSAAGSWSFAAATPGLPP